MLDGRGGGNTLWGYIYIYISGSLEDWLVTSLTYGC